MAYLQKRKQEIVDGSLVVNRYNMSEVEVELFDDMAIVSAKISTSSLREPGEDQINEYRVTNIWVKETGNWKRAGFHDGKIK